VRSYVTEEVSGGYLKALILVEGLYSLPASVKAKAYVVSPLNWQEAIAFFDGKTSDAWQFWAEDTPVHRLLKMVENYAGNLAVYTHEQVDGVMLSRFEIIQNRQKVLINTEFGKPSELESLFQKLRSRYAGC
jgi:hypothetical protein